MVVTENDLPHRHIVFHLTLLSLERKGGQRGEQEGAEWKISGEVYVVVEVTHWFQFQMK